LILVASSSSLLHIANTHTHTVVIDRQHEGPCGTGVGVCQLPVPVAVDRVHTAVLLVLFQLVVRVAATASRALPVGNDCKLLLPGHHHQVCCHPHPLRSSNMRVVDAKPCASPGRVPAGWIPSGCTQDELDTAMREALEIEAPVCQTQPDSCKKWPPDPAGEQASG
jgi:hypothetical protein